VRLHVLSSMARGGPVRKVSTRILGLITRLMLLGSATACGNPRVGPTPSTAQPAAGTYAIRICSSPCDPARPDSALAEGHLVLEEQAYTPEEVSSVQREYGGSGAFLYRAAGGEPNACFGLSRRRRSRSYAGLKRAGLTRWRGFEGSDTVSILLYSSPDADYLTTLRVRGRELIGGGESIGGRGPEEPAAPRDSVYARRIGPVDRGVCLRAAGDTTSVPGDDDPGYSCRYGGTYPHCNHEPKSPPRQQEKEVQAPRPRVTPASRHAQ